MVALAHTLPGVELVLDRETVHERYQLPADREGDFAIFSDRRTVLGAGRGDHDLGQLAGRRLRSPGGLAERRVPFLLSRPLNAAYRTRAAAGPPHNYDIFDFALNGVF